MKTISKALAKASVMTIAAGAMAMTSAAPAFARHRDNNRIDAGEVIAGAVILGGIAAILSSSSNRNRDRYGNRDRNYRSASNNRGNGRRAVERCVRAVERDARRAGYRFANVTQIRDVDNRRNGWRVKGRLVVDNSRGHANQRYDRQGRRGYGNDQGTYRQDRRGYGQDHRGYRQDRRGYRNDSGTFRCNFSRGRVVGISYNGIRGLR